MDEDMRDAPNRPAPPAPVFRPPKQISRPKPPVQQEEELGAEPKLGDFEDVHALSVSEARAVITAVHAARQKRPANENPLGPDRTHNDSQTINQFVEYLETFSRYKQNENLHALSGLLDSQAELTSVEKAMLGSLACDSADEAKTLIPSLANKLGDESLQNMLDDMSKLRPVWITNWLSTKLWTIEQTTKREQEYKREKERLARAEAQRRATEAAEEAARAAEFAQTMLDPDVEIEFDQPDHAQQI